MPGKGNEIVRMSGEIVRKDGKTKGKHPNMDISPYPKTTNKVAVLSSFTFTNTLFHRTAKICFWKEMSFAKYSGN